MKQSPVWQEERIEQSERRIVLNVVCQSETNTAKIHSIVTTQEWRRVGLQADTDVQLFISYLQDESPWPFCQAYGKTHT